MIDVNAIEWSENCVDPGSRVFFVGNRVFRAYENSRKQETLDFLESECYSILRAKRMIVNTWISDEIKLDGYPLILEHEHMCCMPETWLCFEMLKDILTFHFEINEFCKHYGFCIRDIGFGNVTLNNGKLCFIDFGSFRKIEKTDLQTYSQYCLPLAYLPLSIYSKNDGNDFIADSMICDYDKWVAAQKYPSGNTLFTDLLLKYLHPIVSYYSIGFVRTHFRLKIKTIFSVHLIQSLNRCVRFFVGKRYLHANLIEIRPFYSEKKAIKRVPKLRLPYNVNKMQAVDRSNILKKLPNLIATQIASPIKRVVFWGNYLYEDIRSLRGTINCELIVMSSDKIYTNHLYKQVRSNGDDITVICCNAMRGKEFKAYGSLKTDILVLQSGVFDQVHIGSHSDWPEKASYFSKYLITSELCEDEYYKSHIQDFYELVYSDELRYQLYKNKNR